jgi:hypothetical protein
MSGAPRDRSQIAQKAIPAGWSAPKVELVSKLQALLHAGQLKISRAMPEAAVLVRELQDFRVRYTDAGNATFNAREGAHDHLVLALALAVFGLSRRSTRPRRSEADLGEALKLGAILQPLVT